MNDGHKSPGHDLDKGAKDDVSLVSVIYSTVINQNKHASWRTVSQRLSIDTGEAFVKNACGNYFMIKI